MQSFPSDQRYYGTAAREFGIITAGWDLKFKPIHPQLNTYDFCEGDNFAAFAQAHGMVMRGHTMVWYPANSNPDWLINGTFSRDQMLQIMHDHITTVMQHYRDNFPGVITQWDVVNEPIADCAGPGACGQRDSFWRQRIGDDYIDYAFRYAREADPTVKLYMNEYGIESPNAKLQGLINLVTGMQARGVPIDGIGYQFHVGTGADLSGDTAAALQQSANIGLDVAVTELDVALGITGAQQQPTPNQLGWQSSVYARVTNACLAQPRCKTLVTWDFSDAHTWISPDKPCIFDKDYAPKLAYHALRNILLQSTGERAGEVIFRQAEDMVHEGTGGSVTYGWGLWANGSAVTGNFPLAGPYEYTATLIARGNLVGGAWPQLELRVDGIPAGTATVDSASWKSVTIPFTADANTHTLSVVFVNDYYGGPGIDRNVWVDSVTAAAPVEAEKAHTRTTGSPTTGGWVMSQTGYIQNSFVLETTANYVVSVIAKAVYGGLIPPTMELRVDGAPLGAIAVTSSTWTTVQFTTSLPSGTHDIALALSNSGGARSLYIDRYSVAVTQDAP